MRDICADVQYAESSFVTANYHLNGDVRITINQDDDVGHTFLFRSIVGLQIRSSHLYGGALTKYLVGSVLKFVPDSTWLAELADAYIKSSHKLPSGYRHYVICNDDFIWELLAAGFVYPYNTESAVC